MKPKSVLAIGLDPHHADLSQFAGLTPEAVRAYVLQEINRVRQSGFAVTECLISPDTAGEERLETELRAQAFDCVLIGAGLRKPEALMVTFERVVNAVHRFAPQARVCFNTAPADTLDAVQRCLG